MTVHTITSTWKKVLERRPRPVTLLITLRWTDRWPIYVRLGEGAPGYVDADIAWQSSYVGRVITLSIPPNTPVYAYVTGGTAYISCTIIKEMEEE